MLQPKNNIYINDDAIIMSKLKQIKAILRSINRHPLAGKHRFLAYYRFIQWQIGSIINHREKEMTFTDKSKLMVKKGMEGATGNVYMGLHEFSDMGFLLHFLRRDDLFFDIGANIGSYMVLASAHVAAKTFAFEPIPSTFSSLQKNIVVNDIAALVTACNVGVGSKNGKLCFTALQDSVNHVIQATQEGNPENTVEVDVVTIDEIVKINDIPVMIKIDVEGFETEVINGMQSTLINDKLKAIIIELNGLGIRYGYHDNAVHKQLIDAGFKPYSYDPFTRKIIELETFDIFNTLYLRDLPFVVQRIKNAEKICIFSEKF